MKRVVIETYFTGPEWSDVTVVAANGTRASAEHAERFNPQSMHYMPHLESLWIVLPNSLSQRAVEEYARRKVLELCAGKKTVIYSEPGILGKWLRITHA